ncbi:hypothetical protein EVAR_73338_1 [Eumeta japonica]|uniref:Uncharacterized protein n=1 Tax=Eumeta variegata TaxID=151549 RepID=A0A4C1TC27_EUMVA|nr:hypothetical protein EVAR_73338_1 [Eumeta japonica]
MYTHVMHATCQKGNHHKLRLCEMQEILKLQTCFVFVPIPMRKKQEFDGRDSDSESDLDDESDPFEPTDDSDEMEIIDIAEEAEVRMP